MKQHFFNLLTLWILLGFTHEVSAQFLRQSSLNNAVTTGANALADTSYSIKYRFWSPPQLQKGEKPVARIYRNVWVGRYSPNVKAHFNPYPQAARELMRAEQYNIKSNRWMYAMLATTAVGLAVGISSINNPRLEVWDSGLTVASLSMLIPVTLYSVRSNEALERAVEHLNYRR